MGTGKGFGISATAARNYGFYLRFDHGGFVFRFSEPIGLRGLALVSPKSIMSKQATNSCLASTKLVRTLTHIAERFSN